MENNKEYIPIMFTSFDPNDSFFKTKANEHYRYTIYKCCNCENCNAYKRGKCALRNGLWGGFCPYGKTDRVEGATKRSRNGYKIIGEGKKRCEGYELKDLSVLNFTCRIGDYIYIPLPYLSNYNNPIAEELGITSDGFLPVEKWDKKLAMTLINYHPYALIGGEITKYQKEEIPKFITSLKRYFPSMYKAIIKEQPELEKVVENIDYKGKLAKVKTLTEGKVALNYSGSDIGYWDGKVIKTTAGCFFFTELGKETEVIINPTDESYVYICDNNTVTEETEFKNE